MPDSSLLESVNHLTRIVADTAQEATSNPGLTVSLAAILVASLSFLWSLIAHYRDRRIRAVHQAVDRWDAILTVCNEHPTFLLPDYMPISISDRLSYEAYNYKVWSLVEFIISNRLHRTTQFRSMILWIAAHNRAWLTENPFLFSSSRFWGVIGKLADEPLTLFRSETLPLVDNTTPNADKDRYRESLNWAQIASDYDNYVITPLSRTMTTPDSQAGDQIRNHLLTYFRDTFSKDDLKEMRMVVVSALCCRIWSILSSQLLVSI